MKEKIKRWVKILALVALGAAIGVSYLTAIQTYKQLIKIESVPMVVSAAVAAEPDAALSVNPEREQSANPAPLPLEAILEKIYRLESSSGKNDTCEPEGHSGYGYGQHKTGNLCFASDKEAHGAVRDWMEKCLGDKEISNCVCRYNTGTASDTCPYLESFNTLGEV